MEKFQKVKKLLIPLAVATFLFSFAFAAMHVVELSAEQEGITNGIFIGEVEGFWGPVVAEVTVLGGRITDIYFPDWTEDPRLTPTGRDRMVEQIIEHQSLGVDIITGVTVTSMAILASVAQAVTEAGFDVPTLFAAPVNISPRSNVTINTDVLVIGGGGAGLSAALVAAGEGADVVLIEKASVFGGATLVQGGGMGAVNPARFLNLPLSPSAYDELRSIQNLPLNSPELMFDIFPEWVSVLEGLQADLNAHFTEFAGRPLDTPVADGGMPLFDSHNLHLWHMYTGGLRQMLDGSWIAPNLELATIMVTSSLDVIRWFDEFVGHPMDYSVGGLGTIPGMLWQRSHGGFGGVGIINSLLAKGEELGVTTMLDTRGTEIIQNVMGRVIGARAVCMIDGTEILINTNNGVIIATGGFGDNAAQVTYWDNFWGEHMTPHTLATKPGTLHGDGIWMAEAIGAQLSQDMGVAQLLPFASPVRGTMTDGHWGPTSSQIWLNRYGERFVNEYAERDVLSRAAFEQGEPNGLFWILLATGNNVPDDEITGGINRGMTVAPGSAAYNNFDRGYIWIAQTLAELAEMSQNVPAKGATASFTEEGLRATIERHNQIVIDQYDPDFNKTVISGYIDIDAIETGNYGYFVVSPRISSIHHTMGGVVIDAQARVIHENGHPIPGLWAAGEVTGGIHAGNRLGGNALVDIFVFGQIAGRSAAN
ncbi:MAG: FAD-dependent oxidoreductase [Defluviitaleaceae bacterium]|nr:FAD-dependent oxidoreductase [Defluviitaleaceae bacterium]